MSVQEAKVLLESKGYVVSHVKRDWWMIGPKACRFPHARPISEDDLIALAIEWKLADVHTEGGKGGGA